MNEPRRKSYLDLIKANMAAIEKTHFITRLVYFGTYHNNAEYVLKKFENVIKYCQSEYSDVPLTGLLLVYPKYFIHIIETSEELIFRHLKAIFSNEEMAIELGRVLPLPPYHHAYHAFFSAWLKVFIASPPELIEKFESADIAEIERQLSHCLLKVYTLCEYIASNARGSKGRGIERVLQALAEKEQGYLPESTVLEFLLTADSPILRDVREFVTIAPIVPQIKLYNELIWPPSWDLMPLQVFTEQTSRRDLMLRRLSQQQQSQRHTG